MTFMTHTRSNTENGIRARMSSWATAIAESISRYNMYRRTLTELDQLSGRELADLGLSRSEIPSIAMQAAYGN